jgi:predicted ribosome quality control (RQC) complex YloA/Tae2 family protein
MPQDAYTLRYLCEELNSIFSGGKINRIVQPNNDELVLTVYTGKRTEKLLLSVNPASPRIGVIHEEKESPLTAPNFCMLMRKHLLSATIDKISLVGFDRIVCIDLTASAEFFDAVKKQVYVELMGRYSNIILTGNGKVLGGNRGINMFDDGVRPLIVSHPYVFPPVNDKKLPTDQTLIEYFSAYEGKNLAEYLCAGIQGLAVSTANDIVAE